MRLRQLTDFQLNAIYPYTSALTHSVETGGENLTIFPWMKTKVPGSVYAVLRENGYIPDPFADMNSMLCEWVPERWWIYRTAFSFQKKPNRNVRLHCQGIDYWADIYLNGVKLGRSENMHVPFQADIGAVVADENILEIQIESPPKEHGQIGFTSQTKTQKSRFNYKWDWCVRMIGVGLDRQVYLEEFGPCAIEFLDARQDWQKDGSCRLRISAQLFGFEEATQHIQFDLSKNGVLVASATVQLECSQGDQSVAAVLAVEQPALWWPAGHGEQPLYKLTVTAAAENGEISDIKTCTIGFRSVSFVRAEGASEDSLPYSIVVNGKKIYIKGANLTPLEMQRGDITPKRVRSVLERVRRANMNLIRIWGGGFIESETLYEECNRLGILVWQEFIQSSSGIDNIPSKNEGFLRQLTETAVHAVKTLRTHPSLVIYSGGNELTDANYVPSTFEDTNIALLHSIVETHDNRLMLPTSGSGPNLFLNLDQPGQNHDVHGPWKYGGVSEHYRIYNQSDSQLHSEFGADGMNNITVFEKYISPPHRRVTSMENDIVWRHRGEWWDTWHRDRAIFGPFAEEDLEGFIACSQYIQAEGLRYGLEANRRRAFANCGSIIWQYNEPFPNVSGTNLEDYFGEAKLAYWFAQDAFRPRTPSLRYEKLVWDAGEKAAVSAYIANDIEAFSAVLTIRIADDKGSLLWEERRENIAVPENAAVKVCDLEFAMPCRNAAAAELVLFDGKNEITSRYVFFVKNSEGFAEKHIALAEFRQRKQRESEKIAP